MVYGFTLSFFVSIELIKMAKLKVKNVKKKKLIASEKPKEDENVVILPPVRMSDDPTPRQVN